MDIVNIAKLDFDNLSPMQVKSHFVDDNNNNTDKIKLRFNFKPKKVSWSDPFTMKLSLTKENDDYLYSCNHKLHYLIHTYLVAKLPQLRVKDDNVEIAWCPYPGLNMVKKAWLCYNDVTPQWFDDVWLNIYYQFFRKSGKKQLEWMLGNRQQLQSWSKVLPESTLVIPQPWYYSEDLVMAIPLFLCQRNPVIHKYNFRLSISDLLRMRVNQQEVPVDPKYIEGYPNDGNIPAPEMWGKYAYVDNDEVNFLVNTTDKLVYHINDIVKVSSDEIISKNTNGITVDLHTQEPCRAIFWVMENQESHNRRLYSNYTTNDGDNPTLSAKLMYGPNNRIAELNHNHFQYAESYYHFPQQPMTNGYNVYSFSYQPSSISNDIGVVFHGLNAKLSIKLRPSNTDYIPHIYCMVIRELNMNINLCTLTS